MLRISPNEYIVFLREEGSESRIELTSISKNPVTYKIQTTSPEKFRVRPRCGILNPGESTQVQILLKPEHYLTETSRDKFLIMCLPAPAGVNLTSSQLNEVWKQKQTVNLDVEQHRLQCVYKGSNELNENGDAHDAVDKKSTPIDLEKHAKKLEKQLRLTQVLQCVTLIFLFILAAAVVYLLKLQLKDSNSADVTITETDISNCPDYVKGR